MSNQSQAPRRKKRPPQPAKREKKRDQSEDTPRNPRIEKFQAQGKQASPSSGKKRPKKPTQKEPTGQAPVKKKRKKAAGTANCPKLSTEKQHPSKQKERAAASTTSEAPRKKKKRPPQQARPSQHNEQGKIKKSSHPNAKSKGTHKHGKKPAEVSQKRRPPQKGKAATKKPTAKKKSGNLVLKIIYLIFLVCSMTVLFTFIGLYVTDQNEMTVFNHRVVRLSDNGMANLDSSALRTQDLIILREQAFTQVQPNGLAVFTNGSGTGYIARRVLSIEADEEQGYHLSVNGDGQAFGEEAIEADRFVGEVSMSINHVADVFRFIDQNLILSIIFCVSLLALFILLGIYLFT